MKYRKPHKGKEWKDADNAPELGDKWLEGAHLYLGDQLIRKGRGRPPLDKPDEVLGEVISGGSSYEDKLVDHGIPALLNLINVAQGYSGQSHHLRRLLLGVYNGDEWPFEFQRLRALDRELQIDSLLVVALATFSPYEVHTLVKDGDAVMKEFWRRESGQEG